jgi:uroporphyrinogen-III synthase
VDFVTALSVASFENLMQLIAPSSIEFLQNTPLVAPSSRVIQTALERLPNIPVIEATGPGNDDILNALVAARDSGKHS